LTRWNIFQHFKEAQIRVEGICEQFDEELEMAEEEKSNAVYGGCEF
jgi:hypothetical protein